MELPILVIVMDNGWGISTAHDTQHGVRHIADRAAPHGFRTNVVDGNDPIASWFAIDEAMRYVRTERRPYLLEAQVSRLYGHSSSSGATRVQEADCLQTFEETLIAADLATRADLDKVWDRWRDEANAAVKQIRTEPDPDPADIWKNVYQGDDDQRLARRSGE